MCFLCIFLLGCEEGETSNSKSSSGIGLEGYTDNERLIIDISHTECSVGETISIAVTCRDAGGALLKDISVLFSSDMGGEFSEASSKTDDFGTAGVSYKPSQAGPTLISVNASGISKQVPITVHPSQEEVIIAAEVKSWSDDQIEVYLPLKAQTGKIILNINGYEISGPEVTVVPASGYSEQISARFSEVLDVTNPLITGVIPKDSERIYLCDPQNYRLWYLDGDTYNYIPISDTNKVYQPYTGIASDDSIILLDLENKKLLRLVDGSITQISSYVFTNEPMGI